MQVLLRHVPIGPQGNPLRRPVAAPRGASRLVTPEPMMQRLGDLIIRWLGRGLLLLVVLVLGVAVHETGERLPALLNPQVTAVDVVKDSERIRTEEVLAHVGALDGWRYFSLDLEEIRSRVRQLPWVADVSVQRIWPDRLQVSLTTQLPLARWNDDALINSRGQLFSPPGLQSFSELPQLRGPEGTQEQLMRQYHLLGQLLRPVDMSIARLELHERGSWFIGTREGVELLLGRDHVVEKLQRFTALYGRLLKEHHSNIARVDLRYPNGLAVAWRDGKAPAAADAEAER